jgi:vacuolar-type H+-ATPase subunit C/Vma6
MIRTTLPGVFSVATYKLLILEIEKMERQIMGAPVKVFTAENIALVAKMKAAGVNSTQIAKAIGSKNAQAMNARLCQLGLTKRDVAA